MKSKNKTIFISVNDFLVGGAQKLIVDQLTYFKNAGYDVRLITLMDFPNRANLYDSVPEGIKIYKIRLKSGYDVLGWIRLFKILKSQKPDVIFSHLFLSSMMIRVLSFFIPLRIFIVEHNTYKTKSQRHILLDKILARKAEKIITVSDEVKEFNIFQHTTNPQKYLTITNGINLNKIESFKKISSKEKARQEKNIPQSIKVFLSIARLTPQKNLSLLVESFVEFYKRNTDSVLYMLGDGGEHEKLKNIIMDHHAEGYIKLVGNVDDVYMYCRAADFLISTSYIEGLSIAFLEALAFGLPIIATQTGGTGVLLQDGVNGFLISNHDKESVVVGIEKAVASDYESLSREALSVSKQFSVEETNKKYEQLI